VTEGIAKNKNTSNKSTNSIQEELAHAEEGNEDPKDIGSDGSVENSGSSTEAPL
jgi:hypothetical protein